MSEKKKKIKEVQASFRGTFKPPAQRGVVDYLSGKSLFQCQFRLQLPYFYSFRFLHTMFVLFNNMTFFLNVKYFFQFHAFSNIFYVFQEGCITPSACETINSIPRSYLLIEAVYNQPPFSFSEKERGTMTIFSL
jgi:hypothetical protein